MTCKECGKYSYQELEDRAVKYRDKPIFGTDLKRPLSEIITGIRRQLLEARNSIHDFEFGYPGWKERTQPVEGLLTCGLVTLYDVIEELKKFERGVAVDREECLGAN